VASFYSRAVQYLHSGFQFWLGFDQSSCRRSGNSVDVGIMLLLSKYTTLMSLGLDQNQRLGASIYTYLHRCPRLDKLQFCGAASSIIDPLDNSCSRPSTYFVLCDRDLRINGEASLDTYLHTQYERETGSHSGDSYELSLGLLIYCYLDFDLSQ
jgi:hypothetical protein